MRISMIAAVSINNAIGLGGRLPWHLPADLSYFKNVTAGHPVIMGRKTLESLGGEPLKGRLNIVISSSLVNSSGDNSPYLRNDSQSTITPIIFSSLTEAISYLVASGYDEVFLIGGSRIFEEGMGIADRIYLTRIHEIFEGDTFFPALSKGNWREISRTDFKKDERNPCDLSFLVLERL